MGCTTLLVYRGVEQLVARQAHNLEVARSSPASATKTLKSPILSAFQRLRVLYSDSLRPKQHLFLPKILIIVFFIVNLQASQYFLKKLIT